MNNPVSVSIGPKKNPFVSFFVGILGIAGYVGNGWFPGGSTQGAPPFRSIGSDAGQVITPQNSLQLTAVFSCVRLISEVMASLPIVQSAIDDDGNLTPVTNSPIFRMLARSPNKYMTAMEFWEMMVAGLQLWGNAYALKGTIAGRVVSLTPLRPEYMTVFRDPQGDINYAYAEGVTLTIYSADEIFHIKGFGVDGLVGLSPVGLARQTLGRTITSDQAASYLYRSGMAAGGFIQFQDWLTKEQREDIKASIEGFVGSANTGKVMVLEKGATYSNVTMSARDAQMLESRAWNFEEICRWFGVPPALVGFVNKQSSWASSLENTILWFIKTTLRPLAIRIEQASERAFGMGVNSQLAFDMDDLQRGDSQARAALYASAAQNGWMQRAEIRNRENLPYVAGTEQLTVQSNLVPLDQLGKLGGQQGPADNPVAPPEQDKTT